MTSWKTTSAGILAILGGLVTIYFGIQSGTLDEAKITAAATAILGGLGLIFAKDSNVTGGSVDNGQTPPKP